MDHSCGLPPEVSLGLATQTVRGAAQLALESKLTPDELRQMVITPGGTTAGPASPRWTVAIPRKPAYAQRWKSAAARGREMGLQDASWIGRTTSLGGRGWCRRLQSSPQSPVPPFTPLMSAV